MLSYQNQQYKIGIDIKKRGCPCGAASIYSSNFYYFIFNLAFTNGNILSLSL